MSAEFEEHDLSHMLDDKTFMAVSCEHRLSMKDVGRAFV